MVSHKLLEQEVVFNSPNIDHSPFQILPSNSKKYAKTRHKYIFETHIKCSLISFHQHFHILKKLMSLHAMTNIFTIIIFPESLPQLRTAHQTTRPNNRAMSYRAHGKKYTKHICPINRAH